MRAHGLRSAEWSHPQPQIESHTRDFAGPGSPSDPRGRLKHRRREMTRREPPRRGNARSAGPDYHDVHIGAHLLHT
jgi:hypothetical protein